MSQVSVLLNFMPPEAIDEEISAQQMELSLVVSGRGCKGNQRERIRETLTPFF